MTKAEILKLVEEGWNEFNTLLQGLSEAQRNAPAPQDGWMIKDVLAHISAWERALGTWLAAGNSGNKPDIPRFTDEYVNETNAQTYEQYRNVYYHQVYEMFYTIHNYFLMPQLEAMPDENDDPRWLVWRDGKPPWTLIAGNTYEHYKEHAELIRRNLF